MNGPGRTGPHLRLAVLLALFLPVWAACQPDRPSGGDYRVDVAAGSLDRSGTVVSFSLPDRFDDGIYLMRSGSGDTVALQVHENRGRFILDQLAAGTSRSYALQAEPVPARETAPEASVRISAQLGEPSLTLLSEGRPVLSYFIGQSDLPEGVDPRFRRAGYIHPVYTPSGARVTRHFNPGRPHQYGIWSAWARTQFQGRDVEFWASYEDQGRVEADSLGQILEGPVYGGFSALHRFVDYSAEEPVTALNEQWEVRVYATADGAAGSGADGGGSYHLFDLEMTQTANTGSPLRIPHAGYGGISIRGPDEWDGEGLMDFFSSEGHQRSEVTGERVRWAHLAGPVEGSRAGIALLGHPENRNHPQGVFINQTEPFFSYGPASIGDVSIEPGAPWRAQYRFVVHDGDLDPVELERIWNDYAWPPAVSVVRNQ